MRITVLLALGVTLGAVAPAIADERDPIQRVVMTRAAAFRHCYQRELNRNPAVSKGGRVVLSVALDATGAVASAKVKSSTLRYPAIETCLVGVMKTLRFPPEAPRGFVYPFVFSTQ